MLDLTRLIVYYFQPYPCISERVELTLLFIHGAGGTPTVWHLQSLHFKDATAVELPGHPTGSGLASIEQYANFVKDYVTENKLPEPVLVGHSMGGAIAIEYALRYSTILGLVLVGTGARLRVRPEFLSELKENYQEASKMVASWSVSPGCDPVIVERIAKDLLKVKPEVTLGDFMACNNFDRMKDVDTITMRTLIICGADDKMTPVRYSQYLHEKIKGSKLVVIPNAGHAVMLERHRPFNQALEDFLDSL